MGRSFKPASPAVLAARVMAARIRIPLAGIGAALLALTPDLHPSPPAAAAGLAILAGTALLHGRRLPERWAAVEEALAISAGVLIVTAGNGHAGALALLWLVSAAVGVIARGGRVGPAGRILVVAVLASPLVRFGVTPDTVTLLGGGIGLLMAVGRITVETSELLRDPLTRTFSRTAFAAAAERMGDRHPFGVVLLDLDDFGRVNKEHSHAAGDALLVTAAEAMQSALRHDDVLGRIGGDEFAVLVPSGGASAVAERVLACLDTVGVGASAGVAVGHGPLDELLSGADVALRTSKRTGKGRVTVYDGPTAGAGAALERLCTGEGIAIHLQPIVALASGEVHAYEALARFGSAAGGEPPLPWFALADRLGRRDALERACLRAALQRLPGLPEGCSLCVNLSPDLLADAEVLAAIESTDASHRLVIEVSEGQTVVTNPEVLGAVIRLRANHVRFAVNDVGVGHTGLGQVAAARPEFLKLDRSIVRGIAADADRTRFMRTFAAFVRETGCQVIAEGIESAEDLAAVRASGIEFAQGFLLGRPAPTAHAVPLAA